MPLGLGCDGFGVRKAEKRKKFMSDKIVRFFIFCVHPDADSGLKLMVCSGMSVLVFYRQYVVDPDVVVAQTCCFSGCQGAQYS